MRIRSITAEETHALRQRVLRPHQPITAVDLPHDRDAGTVHLGAFIGGHLIGIASFYHEGHADLPSTGPWRLRGMATHPDFHRQGVGTALLQAALERLRADGADLLWCNARTGALPFYQRLGFVVHGGEFVLPDAGPHYVMFLRV